MATILLVEDDESIRTMYTTGLAREGFTVTPIGNAADALTWVEGQHFDVILLDMLLGGLSGIDFLEAAQLQVKSPTTKVIGFSNVGSDSIKERAKVLGVVDFLDKVEFDPIKLAEYLNKLVQPTAPPAPPPTAPPA